MHYDAVTGRRYPSAEALAAAQAARSTQLADVAAFSTAAAAERAAAEAAQAQRWSDLGISVGGTVLLSPTASRRELRTTATPTGQIQLDGEVVSLAEASALVRLRFHEARHPSDLLVHVAAADLTAVSYPPSRWNAARPIETARQRSATHNLGDEWAPRSVSYWSDPTAAIEAVQVSNSAPE
jgi:hypothetical protein